MHSTRTEKANTQLIIFTEQSVVELKRVLIIEMYHFI